MQFLKLGKGYKTVAICLTWRKKAMVVMVLENVPTSLRGELTRWMLEPKAGVFVGKMSAMVRDRLWIKVCKKAGDGGCILFHNTNNEQGFAIRLWGNCKRQLRDFDGLFLIQVPENQ
jgi:CRISPR-associated protein Cas2